MGTGSLHYPFGSGSGFRTGWSWIVAELKKIADSLRAIADSLEALELHAVLNERIVETRSREEEEMDLEAEVFEILDRRQMPRRALFIWRDKVPDIKWLIDKLFELDAETPEVSADGKPFVVRFRQYVSRHLEYEKKNKTAATTGSLENLKRIEAELDGDG